MTLSRRGGAVSHCCAAITVRRFNRRRRAISLMLNNSIFAKRRISAQTSEVMVPRVVGKPASRLSRLVYRHTGEGPKGPGPRRSDGASRLVYRRRSGPESRQFSVDGSRLVYRRLAGPPAHDVDDALRCPPPHFPGVAPGIGSDTPDASPAIAGCSSSGRHRLLDCVLATAHPPL